MDKAKFIMCVEHMFQNVSIEIILCIDLEMSMLVVVLLIVLPRVGICFIHTLLTLLNSSGPLLGKSGSLDLFVW